MVLLVVNEAVLQSLPSHRSASSLLALQSTVVEGDDSRPMAVTQVTLRSPGASTCMFEAVTAWSEERHAWT